MKFGKRLKGQIQESLPEWRDKFLCYKELKNLVRLISCARAVAAGNCKAQTEFVYLLNNEIEKFNAFFVEQEEDFIIRHKELQHRIQKVVDASGPKGSNPKDESTYREEMGRIRKLIVDFHGEMVLLVNYSNVNYTGIAKILKKYEKRTGGVLRSPFIQKVLREPFFKTDQISKLVRECETTIDAMFPAEKEFVRSAANDAVTVAGEGIFRNTVAALVTMEGIRRSSSTYSRFSLPPLNLPDSDLIRSLHLTSPIPIP